VLADMDRDGVLDVAVANFDSGSVNIILGRGDGTFLPPQQFFIGDYINGVAVDNLSKDRSPDLVAADRFQNKVHVLINDGTWTNPVPPVSPPP
jgi:hypothetical protein